MSLRTFAVLIVAGAAFAVLGDTVTWNNHDNNVTFYWNDAAKWTCSNGTTHRAPIAGDIVVIPNRSSYPYQGHSIVVTNTLPKFKSVFVGARRSIVMRGWNTKLECEDLVLQGESGGGFHNAAITCTGGFSDAAMSNRVWIVADRLFLTNAYATVSVSSCGYANKSGPCWVDAAPTGNAGGSHGGFGSDRKGKLCGSLTAPTDPGSGAWNSYGGNGGGAVRIQVKHLLANGSIVANGGNTLYGWGAGAGGSIYISTDTIEGTGTIAANGGGSWNDTNLASQYAGGGGRVSVSYDPVRQNEFDCQVAFSARGGVDWKESNGKRHDAVGYCGSLYFTDDRFLRRPGRMIAGKAYYGPDQTLDNVIVGEGFSFTNTLFELEEGGYVEVTNDLEFVGTTTGANGIRTTGSRCPIDVGGDLTLTGSRIALFNGGDLTVGGDLTFSDGTSGTTGGEIYVRAAPTNGVDQLAGATIDVGGTWYMGYFGGYFPLCDATNGAIVTASANVFNMQTNCIVNANASGWAKFLGPGAAYGASAHGGKGGNNNGQVYDDEKAPVEPGSGTSHQSYGQTGGGVIRINANDWMTIGGTLSANGLGAYAWHYGCGATSGGSVYLSCRGKLGGSATITANGGNAVGSGYGGGGGRIALSGGTVDASQMTLVAAGGSYREETERSSGWGEDGTVFIKQAGGFLLIIK